MQYCNFPEFVINKMGHCFSIPIPCFPTPDINSCNNVAIACCGTTQTIDDAGWKGRKEGGRRTDPLNKLYKFAILTVYAVHQQLSQTIQAPFFVFTARTIHLPVAPFLNRNAKSAR